MTASERFNLACAETFATHCLRLDLDDALEIAAEFQIAGP
jgi:hypothetical protein